MSFPETVGIIFQGLGVTASVTLFGLAYAIPFALVTGILQHFTTGWRRLLVTAVIEFWRSSPVLVLLFVMYYSLPSFGIYLDSLSVAALALGLNIGGYSSQAVRAALQALDPGQVEAGRALGFRRGKILLLIEMPQAFATMTPVFVNQFIQLVKSTSLVSLITLSDMTFRAKQLFQINYDPVGIYTGLLLAYFVICYPATILGRWLEKRVAIKGRGSNAV